MATNSMAYSMEKSGWEHLFLGPLKVAWYKVIHNILPTNERLFRIRMVPTDKSKKNVIGRTDLFTVTLSVGKGNKYGHGQNTV